ncbi:VOC family protein [Diplocloster hominis]|uniref:VOC family protein n=1 Tax=Diplocloster hominis TaxID=3079010 RepID=UPI0031BABCE5
MVIPYLTFSGDCREALQFYSKAFGTSVQSVQTYGDYIPEGAADLPVNLKDWILHAEMQICQTNFWFADEAVEPVTKGTMVKLSVPVSTAADARCIFEVLSQDAVITLPPTETFYSTFHAGLIDRFGISWNIVADESPGR